MRCESIVCRCKQGDGRASAASPTARQPTEEGQGGNRRLPAVGRGHEVRRLGDERSDRPRLPSAAQRPQGAERPAARRGSHVRQHGRPSSEGTASTTALDTFFDTLPYLTYSHSSGSGQGKSKRRGRGESGSASIEGARRSKRLFTSRTTRKRVATRAKRVELLLPGTPRGAAEPRRR
jgi:hypothetical protein